MQDTPVRAHSTRQSKKFKTTTGQMEYQVSGISWALLYHDAKWQYHAGSCMLRLCRLSRLGCMLVWLVINAMWVIHETWVIWVIVGYMRDGR